MTGMESGGIGATLVGQAWVEVRKEKLGLVLVVHEKGASISMRG